MYNKYFSEDAGAFSELYRPVEYEEEKREESVATKKESEKSFDLRRLLRVIDIEKIGILPIVLLLLLLIDVDDDEKLIIIALAVIFGI
ncbi:MAG: hypothetical protein IKM21_04540 [Oscillospiraceae bacterium]|nr:hypothetical protein [Oscillospiraceae bacterium]